MGISEIVASVDREIALLQQARALLSDASATAPRRRTGRSKKAAAAVKSIAPKPAKRARKGKLSPEGRKRIAEAVKRRWEAHRKAASAAK
jgi:hypothetical protein